MKNHNLKKILNKTIILIVTFALLCSMSVSAAVTLDADVTKDNATLTVSCGESFAGKNVIVQVYEPTGTVDDLYGDDAYDVTDAETLEKALVCVYHGKLDANGEVTFTVAPTGPKGVYGVRISVKSIYEPTETEFVFSSEDDAQQVIDNLTADLDADAVAEVLKKDPDASDRIYQSYQILGLADSAYYTEYDKGDDDTFKPGVHANIAKNLDTEGDITPADFTALFEEAVVVESVNVLTGDALELYIGNNHKKLGLDVRNEYKNIYLNPKRFDSDAKAALLDTLEDETLTGKTAKEVADFFCEEILVNILPGSEDAPGVIDSFILEFATTLEANGADMDAYENSDKPLDLCTDIAGYAPFETIKDFADAINSVLDDAEGTEDGEDEVTPSRPSGVVTGVKTEGSFSSTTSGTSYTPGNANINVQVPNVSVFSDLATTHWAYESIVALKDEGIISGKGDGSFAPNDNVTREEFVKMLVLSLGLNNTDGETPVLSDMSGNEWFAPYVYAAFSSGIVNGIGEGFGVGQNITRQDMAVLCARAIEFKAVTLETVRENMAFADEISDYAKDAVAKLWGAGLVNGKSETEFAPKATATRAEAAKMLYEVLKAIR